MTSLPPEIAEKILRSNADVHRVEAAMYDCLHPEIFGPYEQRQTNRDLDIIASRLPAGRPIRAMDLGCGTGNITLKYLERGYNVRAVDMSPEMLGCLRAKIPLRDRDRADVIESDAQTAVSDPMTKGTYDIVSFSSVLHHLPDYTLVASLALQQLKTGGFLWVCHEPLASETHDLEFNSRTARFLIKGSDNLYILARKALIYAWFALKGHRTPGRIDYSWSDFHARAGIAGGALLEELETLGASRVLYETYNSRFSSAAAYWDQRIKVLPHENFRFIAQTT